MTYGYIFTLFPDFRDGVVLDCFLDVSPLLGHDPQSYEEFHQAAKVLGDGDTVLPSATSVGCAIRSMEMRARFQSGMAGPCYIRSDEPLEPEDIEKMLKHHQSRGTLLDFIKGSRWEG